MSKSNKAQSSASRKSRFWAMESRVSITEISLADYEQAFLKYGGSFSSHPKVLRLLESAAGKIPVVYYGAVRNVEIVGAIPVADKHVLATRDSLKAISLYDSLILAFQSLSFRWPRTLRSISRFLEPLSRN